jgi:Cd2+/Zn2+-exporting ATPase
MASTVKKTFLLEGLDCANCAAKIEDKVGKLKHVTVSAMSFATKTLNVEVLETEDINRLFNETSAIVAKLEPDVVVKEKIISKPEKKILTLQGLDCANCSAKIEKKVRTIDGVTNASVDFVSRRMILEVKHKRDFPRIIAEAGDIAAKIELGVRLIDNEIIEKKKFT